MKRIPLTAGTVIHGDGENGLTYIIDRVIGDGASSIVYEAHYMDSANGRHNVRMKECYPFASEIIRIGDKLVWADDAVQADDQANFLEAYHKLLHFQNTANLTNSTTHVFSVCGANGTLYSVMDLNVGVAFENEKTEKLSDILKTGLALTKVIQKYHDNGYLHLDIKPGNFLVLPETREMVVLFDVDSVTAMEDIAVGKVKSVSYSKGWAAPEQMQGQLSKICPVTDIFSIGAILFEKIMGHTPANEDIGIFADWDFEQPIFEKENPKIKRLLRNIFKKTLSANAKRRYQTAENLISDLEEAIETVRAGTPYVTSDYPLPNRNFIGRETELQKIATVLNNDQRKVFLHGFGGIGKSELAKKYAELHRMDYDAIIFLSYDGSLEDLLEDIQIQNCDTDGSKKIRELKKVFTRQKILLIFDNFDVEIDEDEYLEEILKLRTDVIFTTRTDFKEYSNDAVVQIEVENLSKNELFCLFERESGMRYTSDEDCAVLENILAELHNYTLLIPIMAKYMTASGTKISELYDRIKAGIRSFEESEKISLYKDNRMYRKNPLDMMRATFRMVNLSVIQQEVLTNLYFLRFMQMNKEQYRKFFNKGDGTIVQHIDAINDLLRLNWIQTRYDFVISEDPEFVIHPVIAEMLEIELVPDISQCESFMRYVKYYLPWYELSDELLEGLEGGWYTSLEIDTISGKLEWFCAFALSLDQKNANNLKYVVDTLSELLRGNIFVMELIADNYYFRGLLNKIQGDLDNTKLDTEIRFKIANLFEIKWISDLRYLYHDEKKKEREEMIQQYFSLALQLQCEITSDFAACASWWLCKPALQIMTQFSAIIPKNIYQEIENLEPEWFEYCPESAELDWKDDDSIDKIHKVWNTEELLAGEKSPDCSPDNIVLDKEKDETWYYVKKYRLEYDISEIVDELRLDDRYSAYDKTGIFEDMLDTVFKRIENYGYHNPHLQYCFLKNIDWQRIYTLSKCYLEYCQITFFDPTDDAEYDIEKASKYMMISSAMTGETECFEKHITKVTQEYLSHIEKTLVPEVIENLLYYDDNVWEDYTQFSDISKLGAIHGSWERPLPHCAKIVRNLQKCHWIIDSLIKCCVMIEQKLQECGESNDRMYDWYRTIVEYAILAVQEVGVHTDEGMRYFQIYSEYQKKAELLLGKDYVFADADEKAYDEPDLNEAPKPGFYLNTRLITYEHISDITVEYCKAYYKKLFEQGIDVDRLNEELVADSRLTSNNMMEIYCEIAYEEFHEIERAWYIDSATVMKYLRENDWERVRKLLQYEEKFYLDTEDFDYILNDVNLWDSECDMYRTVLYAIINDMASYKTYMGYLYEDFLEAFDQKKESDIWVFIRDFESPGQITYLDAYILETFDYLELIFKCELAFPYLIDCAEYIHDYLKTLPHYSESMMYDWYKTIVHFSEEASWSGYDGLPKFVLDCMKYESKINEMTNRDYDLTFPE